MTTQENTLGESSKSTNDDGDAANTTKIPKAGKGGAVPGHPSIVVSDRQLRDLSADAVRAMVTANQPPRIFQRNGVLIRVRFDETGPSIQLMSDAALRGRLARDADWYRKTKAGLRATNPPSPVVRDILTLPVVPGIPPLKGIVEAPSFAQDATLLTTPGYHPASQLWFHNARGFQVPAVNPTPSPAEVQQAVQVLLDELLGDFPFEGDASRANLLSTILLPFARELIDGPTPLHLIDAPAPGTGKGLLSEVVSIPATGRSAEIMPEGKDDEEWRKRITAALIRGPVVITIDNVRSRIDSGALAAALTSVTWTDRELGYSRMLVLPVRSVWLATGNNVMLSHEIARRSVWIRLDARMERPWMRSKFRHADLRGWAQENRGRLVHACLTIIQAWIAAGRPAGPIRLGTFEAWSTTMGGVLMVAGVPGFLGNSPDLYAQADDETRPWRGFVRSWWDKHHDKPVVTHDLYLLADRDDLLADVLGSGNERSRRTRLGNALKTMVGRVIEAYRIVRVGEDHRGRQMYRLQAFAVPTSADRMPTLVSKVGRESDRSDAEIPVSADLCRPCDGSTTEHHDGQSEQAESVVSPGGQKRSAKVGGAMEAAVTQSLSHADLDADVPPTLPTSDHDRYAMFDTPCPAPDKGAA
jgi:hypothetical protein